MPLGLLGLKCTVLVVIELAGISTKQSDLVSMATHFVAVAFTAVVGLFDAVR